MAVDVVKERLHVLGRASALVLVELHMTVAPVEAPLPGLRGVAQACDRETRPVSTAVPRRSGLDDRDVSILDVALDPDLIPEVFGNSFSAPATDAE